MRTTSKEQILTRVTDPDVYAFLNHFDDVKWEQAFHSVKIGQQSINRNRLILGMRSADITFKKLSRKLLELNFPESRLTELENRYYGADDLGFAIEKTSDGLIDLRVYFEIKYTNAKWFEVKSERMKNQDYYTMPLFIGFKWKHNEPKVITSNYNFIQYMDGNQLLDRLTKITEYIPAPIRRELANKSIDDVRNYVVMEVKDNDTKRFSYDIRFDINKVYLRDFSSKEIIERFKINFDALKEFNGLSVGHISGGKDKNGEDFLTLYFVV